MKNSAEDIGPWSYVLSQAARVSPQGDSERKSACRIIWFLFIFSFG
jgi:hypothetical protein